MQYMLQAIKKTNSFDEGEQIKPESDKDKQESNMDKQKNDKDKQENEKDKQEFQTLSTPNMLLRKRHLTTRNIPSVSKECCMDKARSFKPIEYNDDYRDP